MDKEKIMELISETENDIDFVKKLSNKIVLEKTSDLDELMVEIQNNVVNVPNVEDSIIEKYLLELTNAIYFLNTRCEMFGFYDDITKANARLKYNEAYAENQLNHADDPKKPTQSDNQLYAEMQSIDENVLNIVYSRSVKIVKCKVDAAGEMIRTLSKLLSSHMNLNSITKMADRIN